MGIGESVMQFRNEEHNDNQTDQFLDRNKFHHDGARLADSMMWLNRNGGGSLMWAFDGQSTACYGGGSTDTWVPSGIDFGNYAATANGGPYVVLNGTDEYLSITDQPWQESDTFNFLVWGWAYSTDIASGRTFLSKWDAQGVDERSWRLYLTGASVFGFQCNPNGAGGFGLALSSTLALSNDTWYFVAGYLQPSTLQAIGVGAATDTSLTYTSTTTDVPASVVDLNSALYVGALLTAAGLAYWPGRAGVALARANVPAANIQSHLTRIFASTRWFYQE